MASSFSGSKEFAYTGEDLMSMESAPNYHNWVIDKFEQYMGKNILEVGAGMGTFTHYLNSRFPDTKIYALEPSKEMYPLLEKRFEDSKKVFTFKKFTYEYIHELKEKNIDTIIYNNVLEHIQDDTQELCTAQSILNMGGHILTYSPASPFLYSDFDKKIGHYRRYTKSDLTKKMQNAKLRVLDNYYCEVIGSFLWALKYKILKSKEMETGTIKLFDDIIVPVTKRLEPKKGLFFGKNLLTIGKKV